VNIFGIGGAELVVIVLIMLIVAGPQRMARWAIVLGRWTGQLRRWWEQTVDIVQSEINEAGLDVQIPKEPPTRQNLNTWAQQVMKPLVEPIEDPAQKIKQEIDDEIKKTRAAARLDSTLDKHIKSNPQREPTAVPAAHSRTPASLTDASPADGAAAKGAPANGSEAGTASETAANGAAAEFGTWGGADAQQKPPQTPSAFGTWAQKPSEDRED